MQNLHQIQAHLISAKVEAIQYPPRFRCQIGFSQTTSIGYAIKYLHYIAQIVGYHSFRGTKINGSLNIKLATNVVCQIIPQKYVENKYTESSKSKEKIGQQSRRRTSPKDSVNFLVSSSRLYKSDYRSSDDNIVAMIHNDLEKIEFLSSPSKSKISQLIYLLTQEVPAAI